MIGSSRTPWAAKVIRRQKAEGAWSQSAGDHTWVNELGWCVAASGIALGAVLAAQQVARAGVGR